MELREIVAPTMKELFVKEIERKILSGEWKVGERLPTEREMEQKMKVSRTSINTGLAELQRNGFVRVVPRQGVYVADYIKDGKINTLTSIMNFHNGKLDRKTFHSMMLYRYNNDAEGAYYAALNRTDEDLARLREIRQKTMEETDVAALAELRFEFFQAIYIASDNIIYTLIWNSFREFTVNMFKMLYPRGDYRELMLYDEIINAIEARDAEEARKTMRTSLDVILKMLEDEYFAQ